MIKNKKTVVVVVSPEWEKWVVEWPGEPWENLVESSEALTCTLVEYIQILRNPYPHSVEGIKGKDDLSSLLNQGIQLWELKKTKGVGEFYLSDRGVLKWTADVPASAPDGTPGKVEVRFVLRILGEECEELVSPWEKEHPDSVWVAFPDLLATPTPTMTTTSTVAPTPTGTPTPTKTPVTPEPEPSPSPTPPPGEGIWQAQFTALIIVLVFLFLLGVGLGIYLWRTAQPPPEAEVGPEEEEAAAEEEEGDED